MSNVQYVNLEFGKSDSDKECGPVARSFLIGKPFVDISNLFRYS
jgi:hypothetical protein